MKRVFYFLLVILLVITGCRKDKPVRTSGIDTIENTLYGTGPYYANGFSFSRAEKVSTLDDPGPDIVLYLSDNGLSSKLTLQASNFKDSFYKVGDYPDAASAITVFDSLKNIGVFLWEGMANPIETNQVWVYRSGSDRYTKIRIISTDINDTVTPLYGECTFEWLYQPDESLTFPGK